MKNEKKRPDEVALNKIQMKRLASIANLEESELKGKSIAQLKESHAWKIDFSHLLYKRVCGRVVKKDPVTGIEYPVPFAKVIAEDTDSNMIIYHPAGSPWSWFFPLFFHREEIGHTYTDACGNFCIWIPRFDIDWIRRWRKERICFPILFRRPRIFDLIEKFQWPPVPNPPDPNPWEDVLKLNPEMFGTLSGKHSDEIKSGIQKLRHAIAGGMKMDAMSNPMDRRLFEREMPPPLDVNHQNILSERKVVSGNKISSRDLLLSDIQSKLDLPVDLKILEKLDLSKYAGPFMRCRDVYFPVWQMVMDIPDITFRVTQDTDGDGTEEVIYSESMSDVRWDAGSISNVTLQANARARESRLCHPVHVPCNGQPDILMADYLPLRNANYFNDNTGLALRANRPRPHLPADQNASTPLCGQVNLFGCVDFQGAKYYRIKQSTDNGATFHSITGLSWNNYNGSTPILITADASGWYEINPSGISRNSLFFENLLLSWPTPLSEKSILRLELGSSTHQVVSVSPDLAITTDNHAPILIQNYFKWKFDGESDSMLREIDTNCPVIRRGLNPRDIEIVIDVTAASQHLRDASLGYSDCSGVGGGGALQLASDSLNKMEHWYQNAWDNNVQLHQRFKLGATSNVGTYSFTAHANGRSINPSDSHSGLVLDWFSDPLYLYTGFRRDIAVVNEN